MSRKEFRYYALWMSLFMIIIYMIQVMIPGFTELFVLNQEGYVQVWRFITAIFLHGSITHLLYNLFALALFGSILEGVIKSKKFLWVFFISGIIANIIGINYYTSSLGASGAVYGLMGCLAILRPKIIVWVYGMPMPMFLALALWTFGSIMGLFIPSNIGHIAHLSGIIIGIIMAIIWKKKFVLNKRKEKRMRLPEAHVREWEKRYLGI